MIKINNMRVLWFTNSLCDYKQNSGYNGGGWMISLLETLKSYRKEIQLGISFSIDGEPLKVDYGGKIYYPVPCHNKNKKDKLMDILKYKNVKRDEILWCHYINHFKRVIYDFKPDVIEVFGSELYIGLASIAAKELNIPCCLHIQGLLSLYIYTLLPIGVSEKSFMWKDGIKKALANFQFLTYWKRSAFREKTILKSVSHVIGRTEWDKCALKMLNPQAEYHYGGEILRSCFYKEEERVIPSKPTIVTTSSGATYKGFDIVLKIANILKTEIHLDFEWKVYGNVEPDFFEEITSIKHQDVNVALCGVASAEQLKEAMLNATVYLQPSYIENSPNSVAEAQILGLPVVATNVGGTSSMIEDGKTGLLFPCTDPYMGAYSLLKLIQDINLNVEIGNEAQKVAKERHNPNKIVEQLIETYKEVMNDK